jgi:hypothetical protein
MPIRDSRGGRGLGGSKPTWQSQNQFMENLFVRKREVENRRNALWDSTAKYFDRLQRQNKMFESWNTPGKILSDNNFRITSIKSHSPQAFIGRFELFRRSKQLIKISIKYYF